MSPRHGTPEPTELIHLPRPSWKPALFAAAIAGVIAGLFTWWPYAAIAAIAGAIVLIAWVRDSRAELEALPRSQRISTSPLPPSALETSPRPRR